MINIVLFEPEIPQNTGNIMRTCVAANMFLHLIEPLGFSLDEKHLRRSGLDYIKDLKYKVYPNYQEFLKQNKIDGNIFYITRYSKQVYSDINYPSGDIYLMFGKESTGIPLELLHDNLDYCVRIPMVEDARSLNLSNCVALVSYEVQRQHGFKGLATHETLKGEDWIY